MLTATFSSNFTIRFPQIRIISTNFNRHKRAFVGGFGVLKSWTKCIPDQTQRLPYFHGFELFGVFCWVATKFKRLFCQKRRTIVVAMPCTSIWRKTSDDHIGLVFSDEINDVCQNLVLAPKIKGFFTSF